MNTPEQHVESLESLAPESTVTRANCICGWTGYWLPQPASARRAFTTHFNEHRRTA